MNTCSRSSNIQGWICDIEVLGFGLVRDKVLGGGFEQRDSLLPSLDEGSGEAEEKDDMKSKYPHANHARWFTRSSL